jgi:hypothetical protein
MKLVVHLSVVFIHPRYRLPLPALSEYDGAEFADFGGSLFR